MRVLLTFQSLIVRSMTVLEKQNGFAMSQSTEISLSLSHLKKMFELHFSARNVQLDRVALFFEL
jgi:hypothetical protein